MDKKVVLVTGSSIGLGRAIIEKFASNNYNVIINYNNSKQEAEELKSYIENTYHTKAITIKCDITKESEIEEMKQIVLGKEIVKKLQPQNKSIVYFIWAPFEILLEALQLSLLLLP